MFGSAPAPHTCLLESPALLTRFFSSASISAYVFPVPLISIMGSHPKLLGPLAGTIVPSVRPSNKIGSAPASEQYANVQMAVALRSSNPSRRVLRPLCPREERKCLM